MSTHRLIISGTNLKTGQHETVEVAEANSFAALKNIPAEMGFTMGAVDGLSNVRITEFRIEELAPGDESVFVGTNSEGFSIYHVPATYF